MSEVRIYAETSRLILRDWRDEDLPAFAALNADPRVMEFMGPPFDRAVSDAFVARKQAALTENGFGLWAIEVPSVAGFIGFVGIQTPNFETHFTPCIEIGWRLAFEYWGNGYASEAARVAVTYFFDKMKTEEIVSFTVPANVRSRRVMERLGMVHDQAGDFEHPNLPKGHALSRHVLYRLLRSNFEIQPISN